MVALVDEPKPVAHTHANAHAHAHAHGEPAIAPKLEMVAALLDESEQDVDFTNVVLRHTGIQATEEPLIIHEQRKRDHFRSLLKRPANPDPATIPKKRSRKRDHVRTFLTRPFTRRGTDMGTEAKWSEHTSR